MQLLSFLNRLYVCFTVLFLNLSVFLLLQYSLGFNETNLRRLVILQKRIIRIINKSHLNAHTDPIFKDLGILIFNDIHFL